MIFSHFNEANSFSQILLKQFELPILKLESFRVSWNLQTENEQTKFKQKSFFGLKKYQIVSRSNEVQFGEFLSVSPLKETLLPEKIKIEIKTFAFFLIKNLMRFSLGTSKLSISNFLNRSSLCNRLMRPSTAAANWIRKVHRLNFETFHLKFVG